MSNTTTDRRRNEAGEVDYHCPNGHHVTRDNVAWRVNGSGSKTPSCRECKRIYRADFKKKQTTKDADRRRYQARKRKSTSPVYDSMGNAIPLEEYLGAEKRNVPWNLLRPSPAASGVFDEFHEALTYTDVPCRGNWQAYTEYQDPRPAYADDNEGRPAMPGREQARKMCADCPLLMQCGAYALVDKPDIGIWGGMRFLNGKVV